MRTHQKVKIGTVLSNKMQKTVVVAVERRVLDDTFKKYRTRSNKLKAHDEKNECRIGDLVEVVESRPLSREKSWRVKRILVKGEQGVGGSL